MKPLRVRDLYDQTGATDQRPFLRCAKCGAKYSANRGDYFAAHPDRILKCCGRPLARVRQIILYEPA